MKQGLILLFLLVMTPVFSPIYAIHPIKKKQEQTIQTDQLSRKEKRALKKQHRKEKRVDKLLNNRRRSRGNDLLLLGLVMLGVALLLGLLSLLISVFGLLGFIAKLFALAGVVLIIVGLV